MAEAYDWGPDELSGFADLIGVQIDQEPTWGQQQAAIGAAIRERKRVDYLAGVLLAMHAVRVEPTLADEEQTFVTGRCATSPAEKAASPPPCPASRPAAGVAPD
jgi:hypothetical protein